MIKKLCIAALILFSGIFLFADKRALRDIYPDMTDDEIRKAYSEDGISYLRRGTGELKYTPPVTGNFNVLGPLPAKKYSHIVEIVRVIPYNGKKSDLLSIYNALLKVKDLNRQLYHSFSKDEYLTLFKETSLVESKKRPGVLLPDPSPASFIPASQTMYLYLKDSYFGNTYYEATIKANLSGGPGQGLLYSITNFKTINYILPVIPEEKLLAQLYIEPVKEGFLIYSASGADVSTFVASQISIRSLIEKRLAVFVNWMLEGL